MNKKDVQETVAEILAVVEPIVEAWNGVDPEDIVKVVKAVLEKLKPALEVIVLSSEEEWVAHVRRLRLGLAEAGFSSDYVGELVLQKITEENAMWREVVRNLGKVG